MRKEQIGAVMVTYNPDERTIDNIMTICQQVAKLIVVDNGSSGSVIEQIRTGLALDNLEVLALGDNYGIATALNKGCEQLIRSGYQWCVTFDQDSTPAAVMISNLVQTWSSFANPESIAIVGPNIVDINAENTVVKYLKLHSWGRFSLVAADCDREDIAVVITSGALTNLSVLQKLGMFRDDYFIDYVDTEYCLRLLSHGYKVAVSKSATLYHSLGEKKPCKIFGLDVVPTNHSPIRRYYIARNSVDMMRKYGFEFPGWFMFDTVASIYNCMRILLLEDCCYLKFKFCIKGYINGLFGVMGRL